MKSIIYTIPLLIFLLSCGQQNTSQQIESLESNYYKEKYRPQFHFSPEENWMNDPNGMVYYEGEYHLFYQYYPDSTVWGPMHWGHAISRDMVKWEHLPIALYPDSLGYIFSGSSVIDWKNTSGFGDENNPPMVAIYTYHDPAGEKENAIDFQYQGIAYSLDKGRTWTKFEGNPVVPNPGIRDFRDPKVAWNEAYQKWIMTLAVKDHISFYSSSDLKEWKFESDFGADKGAHGGVWECPDLFELTDQHGQKKYVLLVSINPGGPNGGSATQYFVGDFDGENFFNDVDETQWLDYGTDNYAGVTWSGIPDNDGRRLFIGWMSNWDYAQVVPTSKWRSSMTLPRELRLINKEGKYIVQSKPVNEINNISSNESAMSPNSHQSESETFSLLFSGFSDNQFETTLSNDSNEDLKVSFSDGVLSIDRTNSGKVDFSDKFPSVHVSNKLTGQIDKLEVFVDVSSIEVFVNDGELVMTDLTFPSSPFTNISYSGSASEAKIRNIDSIW